jgi:L-2-hydroxycarboxylate dehydrogenase (NAD+)
MAAAKADMNNPHNHEFSLIRIDSRRLRDFVSEVLQSCKVPVDESVVAADVLCTADEWGIRSHGVARLRSYWEMLQASRINPAARPRVVRESAGMQVVDGDNGLGLVVAPFANRLAVERAKLAGNGWTSVFNSNHFGIAGYYSTAGVDSDLIGFATTNTPPLISQESRTPRLLGTNPISIAFPTNGKPVLIDMATSAISLGAVENAIRDEDSVPPGCIIDANGFSSTDPHDLLRGGSLLPLGGTSRSGGHKGFCLSTIVDIFCGPLSGAAWGPFVPPFLNSGIEPTRQVGLGIGHLFGSVSVGTFTAVDEYYRRIDDWIQVMRSSKSNTDGNPPILPGDPEHEAAEQNAKLGIPLHRSVAADLDELARQTGVGPL